MSYYDPLLEELARLEQPNQLQQAGQQMMVRGAPVYAGGGFWQNLAAQVVPGLLGAGISYLGSQQNRGEQDALLAAAKLQDPQAIAANLEAAGFKGTAAKVLFAAQAAKAEQEAKIAELKNQFDYMTAPTYHLGDAERAADERYRQQQLGLSVAGLSLQREGIMADRAKTDAMLKAQAIKDAIDMEITGTKDAKGNATYQRYEKTLPDANAVKNILEDYHRSGLLDIASAKLIGRIIAPENVTADDFRMVADATGFKGKAEDFANWWAGEGVKNPQTVVNAIQAANHIISGQYNAYKSGLEGTRSRYAQYGANPARVGDELPLVHITTLEEARKRQAELLAKQAAGKDASSPESMATWLAGLR